MSSVQATTVFINTSVGKRGFVLESAVIPNIAKDNAVGLTRDLNFRHPDYPRLSLRLTLNIDKGCIVTVTNDASILMFAQATRRSVKSLLDSATFFDLFARMHPSVSKHHLTEADHASLQSDFCSLYNIVTAASEAMGWRFDHAIGTWLNPFQYSFYRNYNLAQQISASFPKCHVTDTGNYMQATFANPIALGQFNIDICEEYVKKLY